MGVPVIQQAILEKIQDEIGLGEFVGGNLMIPLKHYTVYIILHSWDTEITICSISRGLGEAGETWNLVPLADPDCFEKVRDYISRYYE